MLPVSGGRDALGITSLASQASLTALAGWPPGREGARMICDLFSPPLPKNTALCSACWMLVTASLSALHTLPCPVLPCPRPALQVEHTPLDTLSASFPYSLPLATPLAGAKLLLRPHLSYIPRHHSRSPSSHHRVSTPAPIANKTAPVPSFMCSDELRLSPPLLGSASSRHQRLTLAPF